MKLDIDINKLINRLIAGDVFSIHQFIPEQYVKLVDIAKTRGILVSGNVRALRTPNKMFRYSPYAMPVSGQLNYCKKRNEIRSRLS